MRSVGLASLVVAALLSPACDPTPVPPTTPSPTNGRVTVECRGRPSVGDTAPMFEMATVNGGPVRLEKGRIVVLDFWATWCEPCEKAFPRLQELYEKYRDRGVDIVAVSVDERNDNVSGFAKRYGVTFPVSWDADKKIYGCYAPPNVPTTYVIDRAGVVRFVQTRYKDGDEMELETKIAELL